MEVKEYVDSILGLVLRQQLKKKPPKERMDNVGSLRLESSCGYSICEVEYWTSPTRSLFLICEADTDALFGGALEDEIEEQLEYP
jgi:hypothetical protein